MCSYDDKFTSLVIYERSVAIPLLHYPLRLSAKICYMLDFDIRQLFVKATLNLHHQAGQATAITSAPLFNIGDFLLKD